MPSDHETSFPSQSLAAGTDKGPSHPPTEPSIPESLRTKSGPPLTAQERRTERIAQFDREFPDNNTLNWPARYEIFQYLVDRGYGDLPKAYSYCKGPEKDFDQLSNMLEEVRPSGERSTDSSVASASAGPSASGTVDPHDNGGGSLKGQSSWGGPEDGGD